MFHMIIDQEIYQGLKKILVASGQLNLVIDLFLENSNLRLTDLKKAIEEQNIEDIYKIAHSIKGSCSMLGGIRCAELCKAIENKSKSFDAAEISSLTSSLAVELENMAIFFRSERTGDKSTCCE